MSVKSLISKIKENIFKAFALLFIVGFSLPSFAQGSGYYEVPDGRPRGVFSTCCCRLENKDNKQASYSCAYYDQKPGEEACPEDTRAYKLNQYECPSLLTVQRSEN